MSDTPRTDEAESKYLFWMLYVDQYGHLPDAMEQAPREADPFAVARDLERELAAVTAERDELRIELADSKAINDEQFGSGWEDFDAAALRVTQRRLDACAEEKHNIRLERDRMWPVVEAAQKYAHSDDSEVNWALTNLLQEVDTYEAATCPSATETP